ncbi:hypothetical protein GQR58_024959 [Nymphon striatum]|nr:hypothetical protein GQR58_024959 [Nymphon striatum]
MGNMPVMMIPIEKPHKIIWNKWRIAKDAWAWAWAWAWDFQLSGNCLVSNSLRPTKFHEKPIYCSPHYLVLLPGLHGETVLCPKIAYKSQGNTEQLLLFFLSYQTPNRANSCKSCKFRSRHRTVTCWRFLPLHADTLPKVAHYAQYRYCALSSRLVFMSENIVTELLCEFLQISYDVFALSWRYELLLDNSYLLITIALLATS